MSQSRAPLLSAPKRDRRQLWIWPSRDNLAGVPLSTGERIEDGVCLTHRLRNEAMADRYDPRSICNLMLDQADVVGRPISNLALQKLLYFAHARHLVDTKQPLVSGYFEAWQYGPVHPAAYQAFKASKDRPIDFRAHRADPLTGAKTALTAPQDPKVIRLVHWVMANFGTLTPGRLVEVSHAKGAPWQVVVGEARSSMALGLRIPDNLIIERFKFHKVSVGAEPVGGEPGEDAPFAGPGPSPYCASPAG